MSTQFEYRRIQSRERLRTMWHCVTALKAHHPLTPLVNPTLAQLSCLHIISVLGHIVRGTAQPTPVTLPKETTGVACLHLLCRPVHSLSGLEILLNVIQMHLGPLAPSIQKPEFTAVLWSCPALSLMNPPAFTSQRIQPRLVTLVPHWPVSRSAACQYP